MPTCCITTCMCCLLSHSGSDVTEVIRTTYDFSLLAYELLYRALYADVRNLIEKGTFSFDEIPMNVPVILTTIVNKVKLSPDGSWDKIKSRIYVHGDIQR